MTDPFAHLKENAWREARALDDLLDSGAIGEEEWHREWQAIVTSAYLASDTPWGQSGKTGTSEDWEWSRSHVADAIDRDGSFLDVGCASGYLMECLSRWTAHAVEPYGLEIAPDLAQLARSRLPAWSDRIYEGNALTWEPPRDFTFVRTGLDYVPRHRRRELVERLLGCCERLVIGVFNEHESERATLDALRSWGVRVAGSGSRPNRHKPGMEYRVLWVDR
ncbi:MAG TPA: class I SAM-dependent methyltransferase [Gaiellaceae bacterium]|nr:class I SAM-dependent methyltransferase [Gaiellaceae bacterium]